MFESWMMTTNFLIMLFSWLGLVSALKTEQKAECTCPAKLDNPHDPVVKLRGCMKHPNNV